MDAYWRMMPDPQGVVSALFAFFSAPFGWDLPGRPA